MSNINKKVLKDFVEWLNNEYNKINLDNESEVTETIHSIISMAHTLPWKASNIKNSAKFPHIASDIEYVNEIYADSINLDEGDIECLIDCVLDFDYSDYNDQIYDAIKNYIAERED